MPSSNFKAIVVGGGPVGLAAAHALTRANIDFVVLESRPTIVIQQGASLVLSPTGMRILGQLGLLKELERISTSVAQVSRCDHNGVDLGAFHVFEYIKNNYGQYPRVISRHDLTELLYTALPAASKERMLPNKKVSSVTTSGEGVLVACEDGTSYEGSIVIGADGVHSKVRQQMRALAKQASPAGSPELNAENPFLTTYRALWVRFPTSIGLQPGCANETHGNGLGIQVFAADDTAVMALYERLPQPTRARSRYTQADEDAMVERWGHLPISNGLTVRDAYKAQVSVGLTDLEEGVVEHWSWNRIVLVGDAAHKYTPSTGAGCNTGIADIVVLVNELHKMLNPNKEAAASSGGTEIPSPMSAVSTERIASSFKTYQDLRFAPVAEGCKGSSNATAMATWQNGVLKFADKYIISSATIQKFLIDRARATAETPVFDFIAGPEPFSGKIPWVQPIQPSSNICV